MSSRARPAATNEDDLQKIHVGCGNGSDDGTAPVSDGLTSQKLTISQAIPVPTASPGVTELVGFGDSGVVIVAHNGGNSYKRLVMPDFGYTAGGWRNDRHVRLLADTTGNGRADIVGFGETGVWISVNNGNGTFQMAKKVISDFAYSAGWRVDKHPRFMADIRNTGRADIIGFGVAGVLLSPNNGDGSFGPTTFLLDDFGYNGGGWRMERHLRFLADIEGRGVLDIVGFGESHVFIARNNGDGTFQPPKAVLSNLCYSQGWRVNKHPRFVVDLTENGKPDLVGFGDAGLWVALNKGDDTFQSAQMAPSLNHFCSRTGWRMEDYPFFIADLTGNGCGDIIGVGATGVYVAMNRGNGTFEPPRYYADIVSYNLGWRVNRHPRFVADMTGNGRPDIVGFGNFSPETELILGFGASDAGWSPENSMKYVANLHA